MYNDLLRKGRLAFYICWTEIRESSPEGILHLWPMPVRSAHGEHGELDWWAAVGVGEKHRASLHIVSYWPAWPGAQWATYPSEPIFLSFLLLMLFSFRYLCLLLGILPMDSSTQTTYEMRRYKCQIKNNQVFFLSYFYLWVEYWL